jgi:fumarylacetoacetase
MKTTPAYMKSWVESANDPRSDFPIQNLPFGVFRRLSGHGPASVGVAIGDRILDLCGCQQEGIFDELDPAIGEACAAETLNPLMALGNEALSHLRRRLQNLLRLGHYETRETNRNARLLLVATEAVQMLLPAAIGDYTDFYASVHHATNVGSLFRPDNPLLPNYKWVPIGYHGRASSIVISGDGVRRPHGQIKPPDAAEPVYAASRSLDYELELGFFVGQGNALGRPIPIDAADSHIFGFCLVNDWSARDIQSWEYQPLGPFNGKNFATTISPWVVTLEALEPFRRPPAARVEGDPAPLPYLVSERDRNCGAIDIQVEVYLASQAMREAGLEPVRLSRGSFAELYWTAAQMLTHHAGGGCNLRSGDLLASGTISGATRDSLGSLLEITRRGAEALTLPGGETRKFLEDGDEVILRAFCEKPGQPRIGFGECRGVVLPAV